MYFRDRTSLTDARRTQDGALVAFVRCARTGCQDYAGYEVGKPDVAKVTIYRPEGEVFSRDAMATFANSPVTLNHPPVSVTSDNWKQYAVGDTGEDVVRDGESVRVPMIVRDAGAVRAIDSGVDQISMGYTCDLKWEDGTAPDGTAYQAIQTNIRINHLAIVDQARGGPTLKIGDGKMSTKTITFDGLPLEVTDAAEAVINKLTGQIAAKDATIGELTVKVQAADGEIVVLKKQVADAEVTPDKLAKLVADRAKLIDDAKKVGGDKVVTDGKTDAEIKRAACAVKLGDAADGMADAAIDGAFGALLATADASGVDPVRNVVAGGVVSIGDARGEYEKARDARKAALSDAWKTKPVAATA